MSDSATAEHLAERDAVWSALRRTTTHSAGACADSTLVRLAVNLHIESTGRSTLGHGVIARHVREAGYSLTLKRTGRPREYRGLVLKPEWLERAEAARR